MNYFSLMGHYNKQETLNDGLELVAVECTLEHRHDTYTICV